MSWERGWNKLKLFKIILRLVHAERKRKYSLLLEILFWSHYLVLDFFSISPFFPRCKRNLIFGILLQRKTFCQSNNRCFHYNSVRSGRSDELKYLLSGTVNAAYFDQLKFITFAWTNIKIGQTSSANSNENPSYYDLSNLQISGRFSYHENSKTIYKIGL